MSQARQIRQPVKQVPPKTAKVSEVGKPLPAFACPPLSAEKMQELDTKYRIPAAMGKFTCYFGKYREKATFAEVADDEDYTKWIMELPPKTSNMYLFQRYVRATHPDYPTSPKKAKSITPISKRTKKTTPTPSPTSNQEA